MRFTVVIPLYNKEKYIQRAIKSVLAQEYHDFEIIVIDDGSTDGSLELARSVQAVNLRVISQPNHGVSSARNVGIDNAQGEFIAFLDADDQWNTDYLRTIDSLIVKYPESDIYVTAYSVHLDNNRICHSTQLIPPDGCLDSYWLTLPRGYDFVWTSATVVRKQALIQAGGFRVGEQIGQDLDMWARVARHNPRVAYSSKMCANYNRIAEGNARTRVRIAWAGAFMRDLEEELDNPNHTKEELRAIQRKYDKKMAVFLFTAILAEEKQRALESFKNWKGILTVFNVGLRLGILVAFITPKLMNQWIYKFRLKVF